MIWQCYCFETTLEMIVQLHASCVLFGTPNSNEERVIGILNVCMLYSKWYIWTCNSDNLQLFLPCYVQLVKNKLSIEINVCVLKIMTIHLKRSYFCMNYSLSSNCINYNVSIQYEYSETD